MRRIRVGLVGTGFMGRTHSNAFAQAPVFFPGGITVELAAVCARNPEELKNFARTWGYQSFETDWRKLVERDDIDLIDIATPNHLHAEIAIAAAQAGKMVSCEKPLGISLQQSQLMADAVAKAGVASMVWYNYRRIPAVTLAERHDRRRGAGTHISLPLEVPAGLDHLSPTCRRVETPPGGSMPQPLAAASPATCWRIASTLRCGSTDRSRKSAA